MFWTTTAIHTRIDDDGDLLALDYQVYMNAACLFLSGELDAQFAKFFPECWKIGIAGHDIVYVLSTIKTYKSLQIYYVMRNMAEENIAGQQPVPGKSKSKFLPILIILIVVVAAMAGAFLLIGDGEEEDTTPASAWPNGPGAVNQTIGELEFGKFTTNITPTEIRIYVQANGTAAGTEGDISVPGLVLRIDY